MTEFLPLPSIDSELCTGCRRCVDICPTNALAQVNDKAFLKYAELCTYCTACGDVCPEYAISLPFLIVVAPENPTDATKPD
ncbi:MAG: 4Fe-4S dicluster domain-containing protein [Chloroflexi bacterium]|nr:4Fe-4S dicluster domain-containing protein [Chloroflexota bacterium]